MKKLIIVLVLASPMVVSDPKNIFDHILEPTVAAGLCEYKLNEHLLGLFMFSHGISEKDIKPGGSQYQSIKNAEQRLTDYISKIASSYEDKEDALDYICNEFWTNYGINGNIKHDLLLEPIQ